MTTIEPMEAHVRITAASALVLAAATAAPALGQSFLGEWTATATTPGGEVSEILAVVKEGDGYAITVAPADAAPPGAPQAGPGEDIVLDGDRFAYKRTLDMQGSVIEFTYAGVVSGDTFTGTATAFGTEVPYNGVRIVDGD